MPLSVRFFEFLCLVGQNCSVGFLVLLTRIVSLSYRCLSSSAMTVDRLDAWTLTGNPTTSVHSLYGPEVRTYDANQHLFAGYY